MNLKDELDKVFIKDLSNKIFPLFKDFRQQSFISETLINWEQKELKERIKAISKGINNHVDITYPEQITILSSIAPAYTGLKGLIFPDFVETYGLNYIKISLDAMALFTQYSSAEFAIRPFIEKYPKETHKQLLEWSTTSNHHLRRLASEGTRPRLPWASKLNEFVKDPRPNIAILENLKNDDSLYVRKSVANHLNDISKDHPELVLSIAKKWFGKYPNTNWIVKHALRTLLKKGNKKALAIFGLDNANKIDIDNLMLSKSSIKIGDFIHFEFNIKNDSNENRAIRIEYKVGFIKSNGSTSDKVFQLSELSLKPHAQKKIIRKQWFKNLSTRKHYPGNHIISIIVNGDKKESIILKLNE